jgi:hypothetical protein
MAICQGAIGRVVLENRLPLLMITSRPHAELVAYLAFPCLQALGRQT